MDHLFTVDQICRATGGDARHVTAAGISEISIDSRSLGSGALFVAIKGDRFDGHDFVADAIKTGAAAALVSADRAATLGHLPLIVVPDALEGLRQLATLARQRAKARIIAVTGSVGKTTTKEALRTMLSAFGPTHASIKSYNNHWGVPLMLAGLPAEDRFGVFEMGMNHEGEIRPLSELVRPDVAVITAIAPAHIGHLGSMEAIVRAKAEIFAGVVSGGTAIINADHEHLPQLLAAAAEAGLKSRTFGYGELADVRITDYAATADTARARANFKQPLDLTLNVGGRHMISNAVAALLVADELQLDPDIAVRALAGFGAAEGRGTVERLGDNARPLLLIDESYNANPASMKVALEVFASREMPGGRKILVLGDMLELGEQSAALHVSLEEAVLNSGADDVFFVGPYSQLLADRVSDRIRVAGRAETVSDIEQMVLNSLAAGDAVMLKASLSIGLGALVASIRKQFTRGA